MKKMIQKKVAFGFASAVAIVMLSTPAFALFTNGGFEDGTTSGWTVTYGSVSSAPTYSPAWGTVRSGQPAPVVIDSAYHGAGEYGTTDINPYNGSKMVKINDIGGSYHATKISQTDLIAAADLTETVYVNWGAALIDAGGHPIIDQPSFGIEILKNGTSLDSFFADGDTAGTSGSGWAHIGSQPGWGDALWYKTGQYTYDLSGFAVGDSITVSMFVSDCGYGAHGGYAFLDGIGTEYVAPPNTDPVPEPGTMLLLGTGLAGLVAARRKKAAMKA